MDTGVGFWVQSFRSGRLCRRFLDSGLMVCGQDGAVLNNQKR